MAGPDDEHDDPLGLGEDEPGSADAGPGGGRLYRFTRRLLDRGDDVKELASALLETSDRAKTEMVRMVAREVRNYLDELRLKEDLMHLVRSHSLELNMSIHLKPLADAVEGQPDEDEAKDEAPRPRSSKGKAPTS